MLPSLCARRDTNLTKTRTLTIMSYITRSLSSSSLILFRAELFHNLHIGVSAMLPLTRPFKIQGPFSLSTTPAHLAMKIHLSFLNLNLYIFCLGALIRGILRMHSINRRKFGYQHLRELQLELREACWHARRTEQGSPRCNCDATPIDPVPLHPRSPVFLSRCRSWVPRPFRLS